MNSLSLCSFVLGSALVLVACGDDTGTGGSGGDVAGSTTSSKASSGTGPATTAASTTQSSSSTGLQMAEQRVKFAARVGAEDFDCASTYMLGTPPVEMEITDFRLYVHDVRLIDAAGGEVPLALGDDAFQGQGIALLDFEDKTGACANGTTELHTELVGMALDQPYTGIRFKVGVPEDLNHGDSATATAPLNFSAMFWSWTDGYKFVRVDSRSAGVMEPAPFFLHLGSTGCTGMPPGQMVTCTNLNRPDIDIAAFDPDTQTVVVDYATLVEDLDIATPGGGAPGCMSGTDDPDCEPVFPALGLVLASGAPAAGQSFFRAE